MKNKKEIGELIKHTRELKKWTIGKLATESKVQATPLKVIEAGESNYTIDSLLSLCDALDLEIQLLNK